ncbi:TauD/TfdA family dioxygenase [Pleionea sediminis]|uniref:TauD/TfdA family dioxygenase n=1 Tax=Pleionea sediminis TaxID=2569479 RepID=UPI0011855865|nr:TauD/TfdA family dioxygenase [Pleionea sediminis]
MNKSWQARKFNKNDIYAELPHRFYDQLLEIGSFNLENKMPSLDSELQLKVDAITNKIENGCGVVILKNFPIMKDIDKTEATYLNFLTYFGHILYQNNIGDFISHVKDVNVTIDDVINKGIKDNQTQKQTNNRPYQTNAHLEFHTDLSDMAGLLCLHNAKQGGDSRVVSSIAIFEAMQKDFPEELAALKQCFKINHQTPLKPDGMNHLIDIPVFTQESGYFSSFLLGSYIKATYDAIGKTLEPKAIDGIDRIQKLASQEDFHIKFRLEPGDLMMVNNHVIYHSRDSYVDQEGDEKRHLLRAWVSTYNNRPLHESFKQLYGERLAAGSKRGGFEKVQ